MQRLSNKWLEPKWLPAKFRSFFFPPPATIFILLSLSWVLPLHFVGVFEGRNPEMCTFGLSGCRVKPRRLFFFEDVKEKSVTVASANHTHVSMLRDHLGMGGSGSITPPAWPHFHQRLSESSSTAARQHGPPPEEPRRPGSSLLWEWFCSGLELRQLSQERLSLIRPPPSDFARQHHQPGLPELLRVSPFFQASGCCQCCSVGADTPWSWQSIPPDYRHHCGGKPSGTSNRLVSR